MANTTDEDFEFSFPATTTPPCFIESPPLWRRCSAPPTFHHHEKPETAYEGKETMCSFQELKSSGSRRTCYDNYYDQEEKMDALWEDLDEKFSRSSGKIVQNIYRISTSSPAREVHMRCVNVRTRLKLSKANGNLPNVLVFIKVLKKIFVLHNTRGTIKKRAW